MLFRNDWRIRDFFDSAYAVTKTDFPQLRPGAVILDGAQELVYESNAIGILRLC